MLRKEAKQATVSIGIVLQVKYMRVNPIMVSKGDGGADGNNHFALLLILARLLIAIQQKLGSLSWHP